MDICEYGTFFATTLILVLIRGHLTSICIHDEIQNLSESLYNIGKDHHKQKVQTHGRIKRRRRSVSGEVFKPLRIHTHYMKDLEAELFDRDILFLTEALVNVTKKLSNILSVSAVEGSLLLDRKRGCHKKWGKGENAGRCSQMKRYYTGEICADELRIPDAHLDGLSIWNKTGSEPVKKIHSPGPGLNDTDYILYVQALSTRSCQTYKGRNVLAYAVYCHQNKDGRPLSGYVNVCPRQLQSHLYSKEHLQMILMHELIHAVGFSSSLFPQFLKCKESMGDFDSYGESLFKDVQGVTRIVTPSIVQHAQKHFNCTDESKYGGPLEMKNGRVTSHWHSLLMYGSIMAPTFDKAHLTILDPLTLGLLEDTGWYRVNFRFAEPYFWGKDSGCNFGIGPCDDYPEYFCNNNSSGCHYLHMDLAECKKISEDHKCKVFIPLLKKSQCFMSEHDTDISKDKDGICLSSRLVLTESSKKALKVEGKCYRKKCGNQTLLVKLSDSKWKRCPYGESLQLNRTGTVIDCPHYGDLVCPVVKESISSSHTPTPPFSTFFTIQSTDKELEEPALGPISFAVKDKSDRLYVYILNMLFVLLRSL